jgi:ankyrin repeat protein
VGSNPSVSLSSGAASFVIPIWRVHLVDKSLAAAEYDTLAVVSPSRLCSVDADAGEKALIARLGVPPSRDSLLKYARLGGSYEVTLILSFVDSDSHDPGGPTALMLAAAAGHVDVVRSLLLAGASREYQGGDGGVPESAVAGGNLDVVSAILGFDKTPGTLSPSTTLSQRALENAIQTDKGDVVALIVKNWLAVYEEGPR